MNFELLLWLVVAHIIADWFFQNDWMARNKVRFASLAGDAHMLIHGMVTVLLLGWFTPLPDIRIVRISLLVAFTHMIIDYRFILVWWRGLIRQTTEGPAALHVAIWQDQMAHLLVLVAIAGVLG